MGYRYTCPCCGQEAASDAAPEPVPGRGGLWSFIHCELQGGCSYHGWFPLAARPEPASWRPQRRLRLSPLAARSTSPLAARSTSPLALC